MVPRKLIKILNWPDPLIQERLEAVGFFFEEREQAWIKFCDEAEVKPLMTWIRGLGMKAQELPATGRGLVTRLPRLSDELKLRNGGSPERCALCGTMGVPCRMWVEGDDTDSIDYPGAARFYMCGECVQTRMLSHLRLYAPAEDEL